MPLGPSRRLIRTPSRVRRTLRRMSPRPRRRVEIMPGTFREVSLACRMTDYKKKKSPSMRNCLKNKEKQGLI